MSDESGIGQAFRQRREARGLSAEQAAFQSKIPLRLLQALESDDYHLLPDPMYLIRFLREYALFLKLDPVALEAAFQDATRRPPGTSLAAAPPPPPRPAIPWRQVLWTGAAILVVTPLVFIALSLSSKRLPEIPPPVQGPERAAEEQAPEPGGGGMPDRQAARRPEHLQAPQAPGPGPPAPGPEASGPAQAAGVGSPSAPPSPPSGERLVLSIRATEPAWVSVRSDAAGRRQVLLQVGQLATFDAEKGFVITLGNAGGVALSLNGVPLPVHGKSGEVIRDLSIPLAGGRLESSPPGRAR